ncbi:MAG: phosphate transport system substrate-binding protein [Actinomycetota bacterium]|nr:phosphate transport system substrate-binding protein [Actinomycetota bacterium]
MSSLSDPQNVLASLGILVSTMVAAFDWLWLSRKRLSYRVQLDSPVSLSPQHVGDLVRVRLEDRGQEIQDPSLVLLRVENTGSQHVEALDFESRLRFSFGDRQVVRVDIPESDPEPEDIAQRFVDSGGHADHAGVLVSGNEIVVPRISLNKGNYFKLLVILSGEATGVRAKGFLRGGKIVKGPQHSGRPRRTTVVVGLVGVLSLGLLTGSLLTDKKTTSPARCESGSIEISGSTAFGDAIQDIASAYRNRCEQATVTISNNGSVEGIRRLQRQESSVSGNSISMSDGKAESPGPLAAHPIAVMLFSVVVNPAANVQSLTAGQIRGIYRGDYTNWKQLGGDDQSITLVGRNADSGTRTAFQRQVLKAAEPAVVSSGDCKTRTEFSQDAPVLRCERSSTQEVLDTVRRIPGAIAYAEKHAVLKTKEVSTVKIDGSEPDIQRVLQGDYTFWAVEYFYTSGRSKESPLTRSFLDFLSEETAKKILLINGHVPCADSTSGNLCT